MASSDLVTRAFSVQTNATTPATGVFTSFASVSGGFTVSSSDIDDGTVSAAGIADAPDSGRQEVSGTFDMKMKEEVLDDFLESAFASRWVNVSPGVDTLTFAKNPLYLTFAEQYPYLNDATKQFVQYAGCQVTGMSFSMPQDNHIGVQLQIAAANRTTPASAPWSSLVAAPAKAPLKTCTSLRDIEIDDASILSSIPEMNFSTSRESSSEFDVRQCDPVSISLGAATIDGNIKMYHDDESDNIWRDAENNLLYKIDFTIGGETTDYTFTIPKAKNRAIAPNTDSDAVEMDMPFGAVTDAPFITRTVR